MYLPFSRKSDAAAQVASALAAVQDSDVDLRVHNAHVECTYWVGIRLRQNACAFKVVVVVKHASQIRT
jgi:hypothetical protein